MTPSDADAPKSPVSRGIMINRGASFTIKGLSITIGPEGAFASDTAFTLALDLTPYWIEIAVAQARVAAKHHSELLSAYSAGNSALVSQAMEAECKAAMQAFSAGAIAIDAFYAVVKDAAPVAPELVLKWRNNRTARHKQIAEVFRRAFTIEPREAVRLRKQLREIFSWRDRTVHPPSDATHPVPYEELSVATEWRFVAFRAINALNLVSAVLGLVSRLLANPKAEREALAKSCEATRTILDATVRDWENDFGRLS